MKNVTRESSTPSATFYAEHLAGRFATNTNSFCSTDKSSNRVSTKHESYIQNVAKITDEYSNFNPWTTNLKQCDSPHSQIMNRLPWIRVANIASVSIKFLNCWCLLEYYCFLKLRKKNYIIVDLIVGVTESVCYLHIAFRHMFVRNTFWFIVLTYNSYTNYSIASFS
jgi:hypothetical protein